MSVYESLTTEKIRELEELKEKYKEVVWKATGAEVEDPDGYEFEDILEFIEQFQTDLFDAGYDIGYNEAIRGE